jgi:hypothetical protein
MSGVQQARTEPDLAGNVYASMGFSMPVSLRGDQDSVARLKPGDLVGWHGANQPDGRYVGNIAIYMGDRQILENYYGTKRVRALTPQDNVFGMPVILTGNAPTVDDQTQLSPPDPGMGTTEPGLAPS